MADLIAFLQNNAALLVAVVALAISLRANYTAHQAHTLNVRNKVDADRLLLAEKKREALNELDRQYTRMATLSLVTSQKILVFKEHPELHKSLSTEFDRLKSNLAAIETLRGRYDEHRKSIEAIRDGSDIVEQDEILGQIRRLSIHIEKDIAHEQLDLEHLRKKAELTQ